MELHWTGKAVSDLSRLHQFLQPINHIAAAKTLQRLTKAPSILLNNPYLGEKLFEFEPREVRRLLVDSYEIRYEIDQTQIYILRLWHMREQRH